MKKSDISALSAFARHVELLVPLLPKCVDSGRHPPKVVNARRLLNKELARVKSIIEKLNEDVYTENNASAD